MEVVTLPRVLFLDEEAVVPVYMQNQAGNWPATGFPSSNMSVRYSRITDTALQTFSPDDTQWKERGRGFYALTLPGAVLTEEGMFQLEVIPATGGQSFVAIGAIERHEEDRILGTAGSGHPEGTIGRNIYDGGNQFEVFGSIQYDDATDTFSASCWLHRNGVQITNPTSCRVIVKDMDAGTTIFDQVSSSPDANGMFYLEQTGVSLAAKLNLGVKARVTYGGEEFSSNDGGISIN